MRFSTPIAGLQAVQEARSDRQLLSIASSAWRETYAQGLDDSDTYARLLDHEIARAVIERLRVSGRKPSGPLDGTDPDVAAVLADDNTGKRAALYQMLARWAQDGYGWIRCEPSFAAALMLSDPDALSRDDLKIPWRTFLVELPRGLLTADGTSFDRALVDGWHEVEGETGACQLYLYDSSLGLAGGKPYARIRPTLQALLIDDISAADNGESTDERALEARLTALAARAVVGALVAMQFTTNFSWESRKAERARSPWSRGLPAHRIAVVGRPIDLDLSDVVREVAAAGSGSPPGVRTLVRGHYKRQVHGVGRSERKIIWIEPHWRGPEDAPILARPYNIG